MIDLRPPSGVGYAWKAVVQIELRSIGGRRTAPDLSCASMNRRTPELGQELTAWSIATADAVFIEVSSEAGTRRWRRTVARVGANKKALLDVMRVEVVNDKRAPGRGPAVQVDLPPEVVPVLRAVGRIRCIA